MPDTDFAPVHAVRELFEKYDRPWWIAGGWALDLYAGRQRRPRTDIDVLVFDRDLDAFADHAGVRVRPVPDEWVGRLDRFGERTADGLPYVAPEIALLFASRNGRPKADQDFAELVDQLAPERRDWLAEQLPEHHAWLEQLRREQEVVLIGGRSGVGKTSVGYEIAVQLESAGLVYAHIEGDNLDEAFPKPHQNPRTSWLCEANLSAMWRNYAALGYRRLIYTNTAANIDADWIPRAMGGARAIGVLLTASDETAANRLAGREIGSAYDWHVHRSNTAARELEAIVSDHVTRVSTDNRTVARIATEIIELAGWTTGFDGKMPG